MSGRRRGGGAAITPGRVAGAAAGVAAVVAFSVWLAIALSAPAGVASSAAPQLVSAQPGDRWFAAVGVHVCGAWLLDARPFTWSDGLSSTGDGIARIEPPPSGAARPYTLGRFFTGAGMSVSSTTFSGLGHTVRNGTRCPDGRAGMVSWTVNGALQSGNPSDHLFANDEVIAVRFDPPGAPDPGPVPASQGLQQLVAANQPPPSAATPSPSTTTPTSPSTSTLPPSARPTLPTIPTLATTPNPTPTVPNPTPTAPSPPSGATPSGPGALGATPIPTVPDPTQGLPSAGLAP